MTTTAKLTNSRHTHHRLLSRRAARLATRFAAAAGAALMVFTGAATATLATATPAAAAGNPSNPYAELNGYYDSMMKAKEKRYGYCWKHRKKYDNKSIHCKLGKKYQDYEVTDLTGPHYDSDAGVAAPGPALRDIKITVPSKFGKTRVKVFSLYNMDKDGLGGRRSTT